MQTQFRITLRSGEKLLIGMLAGAKVVSLDQSGAEMMRLVVAGDGTDVEKMLKSLRDIVVTYERV